MPFYILVGDADLKVLGGSFNIRSRDGLIIIACKTGNVSVAHASGETDLTPGLAIKIIRKESHDPPFPVDLDRIGSWR